MQYEVGDTFKVVGNVFSNQRYEGRIARINQVKPSKYYSIAFVDNADCIYDWHDEGDMELVDKYNKKMSIIKTFKNLLRSEPEKSFVKAGILNDSEDLTNDGKELFLQFLLEENKAAFNEKVVQPILKAQEEEKE